MLATSNIIISDDGQPILMDFGSAKKRVVVLPGLANGNTDRLPIYRRARIHIVTRQEALLEQDVAAEHSTLPYRAPELFDVKTGSWLDEKCDVWVSLFPVSPRWLITELIPWLC